MDSNVLVSVCCITYNHRNFIRRCLDSLINQNTDFRYEIIVHDDASDDGTQDIVREYAERYPDLVIPVLQEENQFSKGFGKMVSNMLSVASGKYFTYCEGDDQWCDPDKLRLQVEALQSHPECALCVHATDTVDINGEPQDMRLPEINIDHSVISTEEYMRLVLTEGYWTFHLSSFMVSGDLFREYAEYMTYGYPSKFYFVGDLPLFLYFALKGDLYYIDRVMTTYTVESGGFMSRLYKDSQFAMRVHQGYVDGLTAFDEFSHYRFHDDVCAALVMRRFEIDRISRRYDRIVQHPEYRKLVRKRGILKAIAFNVLGYTMLIFRKRERR